MPILAPLTCFILIFFALKKGLHSQSGDLREDFLLSTLLWGALVTISTELLSLFKLITFNGIFGFWILSVAITALIYLIIPKSEKSSINFSNALSGMDIVLLANIAFIVLCVGLIALIAPPNNYDSLSYHMARVVHWIQNRSVANYATNSIFQLNYNPWAEYAILHFQILSSGDRFANLVQWFSMVGSILGVSLLAKEFGLDRRGQIISSVIAATIPMGILQGSSTQNDYVGTFWLVCFVYFLLRSRTSFDGVNALAVGAGLGLCWLTKGTGYIFTIPFLIWFGWEGFKNYRWSLLKYLTCICLIALTINLGYYLRNIELYQNIFCPFPKDTAKLWNTTIGLRPLLSNLIRNASIHLISPFHGLTSPPPIENVVTAIHRFIGIAPDDPRTTFPSNYTFHLNPSSLHEDFAGNFLHFILILGTIVAFWTSVAARRHRLLRGYLLTMLGIIVFFNLFVKWNPWLTRYHLPIFVLWSPFVGAVLMRTKNNNVIISISLILVYSKHG